MTVNKYLLLLVVFLGLCASTSKSQSISVQGTATVLQRQKLRWTPLESRTQVEAQVVFLQIPTSTDSFLVPWSPDTIANSLDLNSLRADISGSSSVDWTRVPLSHWRWLATQWHQGKVPRVLQFQCQGQPHAAAQSASSPVPSLFFYPGLLKGDWGRRWLQVATASLTGTDDFVDPTASRVQVAPSHWTVALVVGIQSVNSDTGLVNQTVQRVSGITGDIMTLLQQGQCSISWDKKNLVNTGLFLGDARTGLPVTLPVTPLSVSVRTPSCDWSELQWVQSQWSSMAGFMAQLSYAVSYQASRNRVSWVMATESIEGCQLVANQVAKYQSQTLTMPTTRCTYTTGSLQWAADPCCNPQLLLTLCCAPRSVSWTTTQLAGIDADKAGQQCFNLNQAAYDLVQALQTLPSISQRVQQPVVGCAATRERELQYLGTDFDKLYDQLLYFIQDCERAVFNDYVQGQVCESDADCYTKCRKTEPFGTGLCVLPWADPNMALAKCYKERMDSRVLGYLMRGKGDSRNPTTYALFEYLNSISEQQCLGPDARLANGGWFQRANGGSIPSSFPDEERSKIGTDYILCQAKGPMSTWRQSNCVQVQARNNLCSEDRVCNWDSTATEAQCTTDLLDNNGEFCGFCYGDTLCDDASKRSFCRYDSSQVDFRSNTLQKQCDDIQGQYVSDLATNRNLCVNPHGGDSSEFCFEECLMGPNPVGRSACISFATSIDIECRMAYGVVQTVSFPNSGKFLPLCVRPNRNATNCADPLPFPNDFIHYEWVDLSNSPFLDVNSYEIAEKCNRLICYNPDITRTNCAASGGSWDASLNGGTGYCTKSVSAYKDWSLAAAACSAQAGWLLYVGKRWEEGRAQTKQQCETTGVCNINPALPSEKCAMESTCPSLCDQCVTKKTSNFTAICYHQDSAKCSADIAKGYAQSVTKNGKTYCVYKPMFFSECQVVTDRWMKDQAFNSSFSIEDLDPWYKVPPYTIQTCSDMDQTTCNSGIFNGFLDCQWAKSYCSPEQCLSAAGCNDEVIQGSSKCVLPPKVSSSGLYHCENYPGNPILNRVGCVATLSTPSCTSLGGYVATAASTSEACSSKMLCCESGNDCSRQLSWRNGSECTKCGGQLQSVFQYDNALRNQGKMELGIWQARQMVPRNKFSAALDRTQFRLKVLNAINSLLNDAINSEISCEYGQLIGSLERVACYCGVSASTACRNPASPSILASRSLTCGQSGSIDIAGLSIRWQPSQLLIRDVCSSPKLSIGVSPAAMYVPSVSGQSGSIILSKRTTAPVLAKCYAQVYNFAGSLIGQLRGSCITVSSTATQLSICLPVDPTIPWDQTLFPTSGIAQVSFVGNQPKFVANPTDVKVDQGRHCFTLAPGVYCPASLVGDWRDRTKANSITQECEVTRQVAESVAAKVQSASEISPTLKFVTVPTSAVVSGSLFTVEVQATDSSNNLLNGVPVLLMLVGSRRGVGFAGPSLALTVNGIATFKDVSISSISDSVTFTAKSSNAFAVSLSFSVISAPAKTLRFIQQPGGVLTSNMLQLPIIQVSDSFGNIVRGNSNPIQVSLVCDGQSTQLTSKSADQGILRLTWSDIQALWPTIVTPRCSLVATASGLVSAESEKFDINYYASTPAKLVFTAQPSNVNLLTPFTNNIEVTLQDFSNNPYNDMSSTITVTLSLITVSPRDDIVLLGKTQATVVNGKAIFSGLYVNKPGTQLRLLATSAGLVNGLSNSFVVNGVNGIAVTDRKRGSVILDNLASEWVATDSGLPTVYASVAFISTAGTVAANEQQFVSVRLAKNSFDSQIRSPNGVLQQLMSGSGVFAFQVTKPGRNFTLEIISEQFQIVSASFSVFAKPSLFSNPIDGRPVGIPIGISLLLCSLIAIVARRFVLSSDRYKEYQQTKKAVVRPKTPSIANSQQMPSSPTPKSPSESASPAMKQKEDPKSSPIPPQKAPNQAAESSPVPQAPSRNRASTQSKTAIIQSTNAAAPRPVSTAAAAAPRPVSTAPKNRL